ncbi:hypothetical protein LTR67_003831 [Exophiala xenobiotica]
MKKERSKAKAIDAAKMTVTMPLQKQKHKLDQATIAAHEMEALSIDDSALPFPPSALDPDFSSGVNTSRATPVASDSETEASDTRPQDLLLELVSTPDRGQALFTTRKVKAGTLLLSEQPLISLDKDEEDDPDAIERGFSRLRRSEQKAYLKLFDAQKSRMTRVVSIYYSNCYNCDAFKADGRGGSAIGALASRINHSCVPNVQFCYNEGTNEMEFRAVRDIPGGKEVYSNYDKAVFEVKTKRRRKQQIYYGFVCKCEACEPKNEFWARSDERRKGMYEAFRVLQSCDEKFSEKGDGPAGGEGRQNAAVVNEALDALARLEELLLKECQVGIPLANAYRSMAKWAERKHDFKQAAKWKIKELEVCMTCFGPSARRVKEIQEKVANLDNVSGEPSSQHAVSLSSQS